MLYFKCHIEALYYFYERMLRMEKKKRGVNRKDNKGRVLRKGESQRSDLTYMYRYTDRSGKRKYVYARTLSDLRKEEARINECQMLDIFDNNFTLNQTFDRYLSQNTKIKERTRYKYETEYTRWVRRTSLGNKKIRDIVKSDIVLFYKSLKEQGYSNGTIRAVHKYVSGALQMAYEDDMIRRNYAESCIDPYLEKTKTIALSKDETRKLLETAESMRTGQNYLLIVKLMLLTGLRIGEATGLTWNDVDLKKRELDINHQFVLGDDKSRTTYHIDVPKTRNAQRKVPISDDLYELLRYLKETTYFDAYKFGTVLDGYSGFVIHTRTGLPVLTSRVNEYLKKVVKKYNEEHEDKLPNVTCHTCRRTFCTRLAELNINPNALIKIMGHASFNTTQNSYISVENEFVNEEFFKVMRGAV